MPSNTRVAQDDRRVVLLTPEGGDEHQTEPPIMPTNISGIARARFCPTTKYVTAATAVRTASVMPVFVTTSSMVSGRDTPFCCWSGTA